MYKVFIFVLVSTALTACKEPQVTELGSPIVEGGMTFTVQDYDVRIIEVNEDNKTFGYARPVLAIPVGIKNTGDEPFSYVPTHKTQQMNETSTPLLYEDPGLEASLPPESKTPVPGVYLERGALKSQIISPKTIAPGDSITDTFLFEVPDTGKSLIFSIPGTMHRGKLPILVRIPFSPKEATGPKIHKMGDRVKFEKVEFSVTNAYFENVKSKHATQGKGASTDKLLKIDYTIVNNGSGSILFDPAHRDLSGKGANLFGSDRAYKRVKFSPAIQVDNQLADVVKIRSGESIEDFVLFDVKEGDFKGATFEYPANLFSKEGVARFNVKLTAKKTTKPKKVVPPPAEKEIVVDKDVGVAATGKDAGSVAETESDAGSGKNIDAGKKLDVDTPKSEKVE